MATMTKSELLARQRLIYHLWRADGDAVPLHRLRAEAPEAWHTIEADIDTHEPKVKVSLYLDRSVARLFRAMGKGYQQRINRILDTWLAMKMAGLMEEERALAERRADLLAEEKVTGERPGWGEHVGNE
ncbi:BrnA antitoxin family protein [uncultured Roseobacter sp.]|uniref:BrnA antitoxin family protein n=1 Tax=uncultured Roseobacter sp. TaxID=114847 RepID=UPI002606F786|nr:BrnA antitoxin family protein [uncultured Roseobacter sp.]